MVTNRKLNIFVKNDNYIYRKRAARMKAPKAPTVRAALASIVTRYILLMYCVIFN